MKYNADRDQIELSVGELCHMALSKGHIDCRKGGSAMGVRRSLGQKMHRKLQNSFGALYHSEVELHNMSKCGEVCFYVTGRADGIICENGLYTIDEIKTVDKNRFLNSETDRTHIAQLYCYAYFLCRAKDLAEVNTRIIYYNIEDGRIEYREKLMSVSELQTFYYQLLSVVLWQAEFLRHRGKDRMSAAAGAPFPYTSLRDSQSEMIKECYRDIKNGNRLYCQAPTGIGKTVSTLYPSVKALGEGTAHKIFYLTSKTSIRREAFAAAEKMNRAGASIHALTLSSREQMCCCDGAKLQGGRLSSHCNPDFCPYAKDYYEKVKTAKQEIFSLSHCFDSGLIKRFAKEKGICPYEFSLDLSELCDLIICDYNYVFSPTVHLKRYFDEQEGGMEKYIFLVDEAHNLPDRARDMYSCRLSSHEVEALIALAGKQSKLTVACLALLRAFDDLGTQCKDNMQYDAEGSAVGYAVSRELPEQFLRELKLFSERLESWMKYNSDQNVFFKAEELSYRLYEFGKICEQYDSHYLTFINICKGKTSLLVYCLDPSHLLSSVQEKAVATIMFSATLTPTDYFAQILGGGNKAVSVSFPSPFSKENLCMAVVDKISTRYEDREKSYAKIAACIAATLSAKVGNYMVFFPSYSYMEEVYKRFHFKYPGVTTLMQKKNMTYTEREAFLASFSPDGKMRVGFCVLGGSFSEGIDLPGKRLIGVIVVGVGLPGISDENNIIRDYYEEKCGQGYDYAYTYPGMNNVLQAIGRVIRTETDRGIAVLIDDRFAEPKYKALYPQGQKSIHLAGNARSLAEIARRFWKN